MASRSRERRHDAARRPATPALPVREVIAAAARTGQRNLWRIIGVAVVVSMAAALVDIAVTNLIDHTSLPLLLFGEVTASAVSVLAAVFLSGFLCRVVGESEHGREDAKLGHILRTLPWLRLILADLLVALLVVAGLLVLVLPGLVAMTLFAIVGPVIEIEDRPVQAALRRSARLVRPYFWWVVLLATVPLSVAGELEDLAPEPHSVAQILENLAVRGIGLGLLEAVIGLVLVALCYQLIALDRERAAPASVHGQPARP